MDIWIKFSRLCLKRSKTALCQDTIEMLKAQYYQYHEKETQMPFGLYIVGLECEYMHKKNEKEMVELVRFYFKQ